MQVRFPGQRGLLYIFASQTPLPPQSTLHALGLIKGARKRLLVGGCCQGFFFGSLAYLALHRLQERESDGFQESCCVRAGG